MDGLTTDSPAETRVASVEAIGILISPAMRRRLVPHRKPWVILGKDIIYYPDEKKVTATKEIKPGNLFFAGHLPGKPIFPGVIAIELASHAGIIAAKMAYPELKKLHAVFTHIEQVAFGWPILPGATLSIETSISDHTLSERGAHQFKMKFEITTRGKKAVSGCISGASIRQR